MESQRTSGRRGRRRGLGLIGLLAVGAGAGLAPAQSQIRSDVAKLKTDPVTSEYVIELVSTDGERFTVKASKVEVVAAVDEQVRGTLDLSVDGVLEVCPVLTEEPRVVIGVTTEPLSAALAAQLSLEVRDALVVAEVGEGMPAQAAGVCVYDVITAIDGVAPATQDLLRQRVSACAPDELVVLDVLRAGRPLRCEVAARRVEGVPSAPRASTPWLTLVPRVVDGEPLLDLSVTTEMVRDYAIVYQDSARADLGRYLLGGNNVVYGWAQAVESPGERVRGELAAIREKLDAIESLLDGLESSEDRE